MKELFLNILNSSISASWLILAVMILRLMFRKAPKWVPVLLWGMVAVRLLLPFSIESAWSLIPSAEMIPVNMGIDASPAIQNSLSVISSAGNPILDPSGSLADGAGIRSLQMIIAVCTNIWELGAAVMLLYAAVSYLRLRRKIDTAIRYRDSIFQNENICSPFVLGIFRPRIYLPFKIDKKDLEYVIAHEQAHISRKDHWWKLLGFLLLAVHWFNPFMWMAYVLLCRDMELACDEKVIKKLGKEQRADYTQALLACSVHFRIAAASPLAFGEIGVKERVKAVMNYKKPAVWIVILATVVCAAAAVCFLTNPKQDSFDIKIVIPAGSQEPVVYSDVEISPTRDQIMVSSSSSLGDTMVTLKPIEVQQENAYDEPAYLTPGMPAAFYAEKGAWFQIGISMQNPTDEDRIVYIKVQHIKVRNASTSTLQPWFDYTDDWSGMDWDQELVMEVPEFPGITFHYTPEQITASDGTKAPVVLFSGMPIWSAYFCDLTGDGLPEICASLSMGSGIIDDRIIIFDYANTTGYELEDRGTFDYYLRLNEKDGCLYADKKNYYNGELVESGRLIFRDAGIQIEVPDSKSEASSEQWDRIPMVMIDGLLYLDTGFRSETSKRSFEFDGEITSEVDGSKEPFSNDQSNFGTGYGYQYGTDEGTVEIYVNDEWWIFATEKARKNMQF